MAGQSGLGAGAGVSLCQTLPAMWNAICDAPSGEKRHRRPATYVRRHISLPSPIKMVVLICILLQNFSETLGVARWTRENSCGPTTRRASVTCASVRGWTRTRWRSTLARSSSLMNGTTSLHPRSRPNRRNRGGEAEKPRCAPENSDSRGPQRRLALPFCPRARRERPCFMRIRTISGGGGLAGHRTGCSGPKARYRRGCYTDASSAFVNSKLTLYARSDSVGTTRAAARAFLSKSPATRRPRTSASGSSSATSPM